MTDPAATTEILGLLKYLPEAASLVAVLATTRWFLVHLTETREAHLRQMGEVSKELGVAIREMGEAQRENTLALSQRMDRLIELFGSVRGQKGG